MRNLTLLLIFLMGTAWLNAQTSVSGTIASNTTWTSAGSPYIVSGALQINNGITLTIQSTVEVKFQTNAGLLVNGTITATGVKFTSNNVSKQKGDWNAIEIRSSGTCNFDQCVVEYGGRASDYINYGMIEIDGGTLNLTNSTVLSNSRNTGLVVGAGSNITFTSGSISSTRYPIVYTGTCNVVYSHKNITLTSNSYNGVFMNIYNIATTMTLDTLEVPYVVNSNLTISETGNLIIASENVIKMNGTSIYVNGIIKAQAELGKSIYFTSYLNDNLGGDTNNDGTATSPASGNWGYIRFENPSNDAQCQLTRCNLSYGGSYSEGVVWIRNASPTIDSCDFNNNHIGCMMEDNSSPKFRYNTIGSSALVPLALTFDASPVFENNSFSFSDNQYDAIGLLSSTITTNAHLVKRDVTGIPNVTYLMLGTVTIPTGLTLTIDPGIVIKSRNYYDRLLVQGTLIMNGGDATGRITMTSVYDDNFGNPSDTNKDGTQTNPAIGNWGGIMFESSSVDASCLINYCRIQYARLPGSYYYSKYISGGAITTENASPTISNSIIKDCDFGLYAFQVSNPTVTNVEFTNTTYTPIALSVSANPTFTNISFVNVGWTALGLIGEKLGFNSSVNKRNIAGYNNITYVLLEDMTVNTGTNLDIKNGIVMKFNNSANIYIAGGFKAQGLVNDSIIFTSIHDDNYGVPKDTRNDGDATSPARGNWGKIHFQNTANDAYNRIEYAKILFGGNYSDGIITFTDAGGVIANTFLSDSYGHGLMFEGTANPDCATGVTIKNCRLDPIAMSLTSNPTLSFTSPYFKSSGNGSNGIRILEGTLNVSTTLNKRDVGGIYNIAYIIDQLIIGENAIFTLSPGVVIKFRNYYSNIDVRGALIANAPVDNKIVFTSLKDDSKGGDTNDDGNLSVPTRNDWYMISFKASSLQNQNILNNCILNYGGWSGGWNYGKNRSVIMFENSYGEVNHCEIEHAYYTGVGIFGSANPKIYNNVFANLGETPIIMSAFANPDFAGNTMSNIGIWAIALADENFSLDDTIPQRNFGGFNNITYFIHRPFKVNSGTTIVIKPGTVFKSNYSSICTVDGALKVLGTQQNPVVFTHLNDDSYGIPNDTGNDGSTTTPSYQGATAIVFNDISIDANSVIDYGVFKYFDTGIEMLQAAPSISHSTFEKCTWGLTLRGVSTPNVNNNTFKDITYTPMYMSLVSYPATSAGNTISGDTYKAIGILSGEELVQDVTLTKKDFGGVLNIPYYFHGNYSIGTSVTLTVAPGVVCKFNQGATLTVKRGLIAEGGAAPDQTIVFTDIRDDHYAGDTNADSTATNPTTYYPWAGITFADESFDALCRLSHCVIRYAGWYSSQAAIKTQTASPSIQYCNITHSYNGVRAEGASNPTINYCDIYGNYAYGVENVNKAFTIDATNNYWGSNNGPTHALNPGGDGDDVTDKVNYNPFTSTGLTLPVMGDVSLNELVQAYDASQILKHVASSITLTTLQQSVANVSGEGGITAYDASLVLQYVAGLIQTFPAELKAAHLSNDESSLALTMSDAWVDKDAEFELPVMIHQANGVVAVDAELTFDPAVMEVLEITQGGNAMFETSINNSNGKLKIALAASNSINSINPLMILKCKAIGSLNSVSQVSFSKLLANEVDITTSAPHAQVILKSATDINPNEVTQPVVYDIFPNPSQGEITISGMMPSGTTAVTISVYNATGSLILQTATTKGAGYYTIPVSNLNAHKGLITIKIQAGDQLSIQKVLVY